MDEDIMERVEDD